MNTQSQIESKLREVQAMETIAESLRSIAISFSKLLSLAENEIKEDKLAFLQMHERLKD
jgi:hypothetical protein